MIKRLCAALIALTCTAGLVTANASTATAIPAPSCSIVLPAKVSIKSHTTVITGRPASDCASSDMQDAGWNVSPSSFGDTFSFSSGSLGSSYTFYSSLDSVGVLHAVPTGASSSCFCNDLHQNTPAYIVKYATWAYVSSTRKGSAVHVGGLVHQWTTNDLASVGGRRVYLQRYTHGAWQSVVSQLSDRNGRVSFGFIQPAVFQYRLAVSEATTAWSAASASTFR